MIARADRDDSVRITLYSRVSDWSAGFPMPQDSALIGDYSLDVTVTADDNAADRTTYRLHLQRAAVRLSFSVIVEPLKGCLP